MRFFNSFIIIVMVTICSSTNLDIWEFIFGPKLGIGRQSPTGEELENVELLVNGFGYPLYSYKVTSESGHILTLHRIPFGKKKIVNKQKRVILIHHGLLGSSDMWFFRGPQRDLPYIMADAGFDVWLVNARGNIYSRGHKYLDPDKDANYWKFGIEDLGYYDMPAIIDFVLSKTKQKDLYFLSHSMGASAGLIMCSLRPEYNAKIRLFLALAPLTYVSHSLSPIHKFMFTLIPSLGQIMLEKNIYEFMPRRKYFSNIFEILCHNNMPTQRLCLTTMFMTVGVDYSQFNTSLFPQMIRYYPAGTSVQLILNVMHYYLSGNFTKYNSTNFEQTNISTKNHYDLSKVTAPISIYYGDGDFLVTEKDVDELSSRLPNVVGKFKVPHSSFNHLDFVFAIDSKTLLYDSLVNLMNKYR